MWNKVMGTALAMPGVKVDRDDFLKKELCNYCSQEQIEQAISTRPIDIVPIEILDKIANACINSHTTKVTVISAVAQTRYPDGIPILSFKCKAIQAGCNFCTEHKRILQERNKLCIF